MPRLWRALIDGREDLTAGDVALALLEHALNPRTVAEAATDLLLDGAFEAVARLLDEAVELDTLELARLRTELRDARLLVRQQQKDRRHAPSEDSASMASQVEDLRRRLEERLEAHGVAGTDGNVLAEAARTALDSAPPLLGPAAAMLEADLVHETVQLPPVRPSWPYTRMLPVEMREWFRDPSRGPAGFRDTWAAAADDADAGALLDALLAVMDAPGVQTIQDFVAALEASVIDGALPKDDPVVEEDETGWWSRVRGLMDPGLPAPGPAPGEMALFVPRPDQMAGRARAAAWKPWPFLSLSLGGSTAGPGPDAIRLGWPDLFGLVGDRRSRRLHLLRIIGSGLAFGRGWLTGPTDTGRIFGMEATLERLTQGEPVQLVHGSPGSGTRTLCEAAAASLQQRGARRHQIETPVDPEAWLAVLARMHRNGERPTEAGARQWWRGVRGSHVLEARLTKESPASLSGVPLALLSAVAAEARGEFRVLIQNEAGLDAGVASSLEHVAVTRIPALGALETANYWATLGDRLGLVTDDPVVPALVYWATAGRPALLRALVDVLGLRLTKRNGSRWPRMHYDRRELLDAFGDEAYRSVVERVALAPAAEDPWVQATWLAALTETVDRAARGEGSFLFDELVLWLEDAHANLDQVKAAIRHLERAGLVQVLGAGRGRVPPSGIVEIAIRRIGDPFLALETAARSLSASVEGADRLDLS